MRILSGMAAHLGATIMIVVVQPTVDADDMVSVQPGTRHASPCLESNMSSPHRPGCPEGDLHPYAVFWRGFCLCNSIREQAKLDRFRYPDFLRHQQAVAARRTIPLRYRLHDHKFLGFGHRRERCDATHVRTGIVEWLSRVLHLRRGRYHVVSVDDTLVMAPSETSSAGKPIAPSTEREPATKAADRKPVVISVDRAPPTPTVQRELDPPTVEQEFAVTEEAYEPQTTTLELDPQTSAIGPDSALIPLAEPAPVELDETTLFPQVGIEQNDGDVLFPANAPTFTPPKPRATIRPDEKAITFPAATSRGQTGPTQESSPQPISDEDAPRPPKNKVPKTNSAAPPATDESTSNDEFSHLFH